MNKTKAELGSLPLISIIVRTLGRRTKLLSAALGSIAAQTYDNIEVVVVEDGGNRISDIIAIANESSKAAFIHHPIEKSGRCRAGNAGLEIANGEFLGFLDEDDELYPEHVEVLTSAMMKQSRFELVYGQAHKALCKGLNEDSAIELQRLPGEGFLPFSRTKLWQKNQFPIQAALFKRSLFDNLGGFDPELDLLEDWDLWLRYSAKRDFLAVNAYTSLYRMPSRQRDVKERETSHEIWRHRVLQKHRDLRGEHRFEDIVILQDEIVRQLPFRAAARATASALIDRIKNLGKNNA